MLCLPPPPRRSRALWGGGPSRLLHYYSILLCICTYIGTVPLHVYFCSVYYAHTYIRTYVCMYEMYLYAHVEVFHVSQFVCTYVCKSMRMLRAAI